jgi:hypothetical protein
VLRAAAGINRTVVCLKGGRQVGSLRSGYSLRSAGTVAAGEITPADAGEIPKLIEAYVKAFETAELAERLERLERMTTQ